MTSETKDTAEATPHAAPHDSSKKTRTSKEGNVFARANKPRRIWIGIGILAAIALGVAGYWFFFVRGIVYSDDARFNGHMVDVAPTVGGRAISLLVKEGDAVRKGQLLLEIDSSVQRTVVAQGESAVVAAQAGLAVARAKQERAKNGPQREEIRVAEAVAARLQNEDALARTELERMQALRKDGAGTQDQLDRAAAAYESARQSHESAAQSLSLLRQGTRTDDLEVASTEVKLAQGRVAEAEAALAKAKVDLGFYSIAAPFDGYVVRRWIDPGAVVQAGQPVVSVFDPATLRVDANIEEKYLDEVALGNDVDIRVDAYPHLRLKGRVADILRAVNSEFSLVPAEGVSGTFIKVTQRVPLRIALSVPPGLALGPGMSVEVYILSGTRNRDTPPPPAQ